MFLTRLVASLALLAAAITPGLAVMETGGITNWNGEGEAPICCDPSNQCKIGFCNNNTQVVDNNLPPDPSFSVTCVDDGYMAGWCDEMESDDSEEAQPAETTTTAAQLTIAVAFDNLSDDCVTWIGVEKSGVGGSGRSPMQEQGGISCLDETRWSFTNLDTQMELFRQGNETTNLTTSSETSLNLTAGTYQFLMEDSGTDGTCCTNGTATIAFSNDSQMLYQQNGNFTDRLKIHLVVEQDGSVSSIAQVVDATRDPDWPGLSGNAQNHSFTLNVRFNDEAPQNVTLEILKKDDTYFSKNWLEFYEYGGVANDANTLWSQTFENVESGVYYFHLLGSGLNWATITNRTDVVWQWQATDTQKEEAETFLMVVGWYGYTLSHHWTGNPPP